MCHHHHVPRQLHAYVRAFSDGFVVKVLPPLKTPLSRSGIAKGVSSNHEVLAQRSLILPHDRTSGELVTVTHVLLRRPENASRLLAARRSSGSERGPKQTKQTKHRPRDLKPPTSAPRTPRLTVAPLPASYMDSFSDRSPHDRMLTLRPSSPPPLPAPSPAAGKRNSGRWMALGLLVDWCKNGSIGWDPTRVI